MDDQQIEEYKTTLKCARRLINESFTGYGIPNYLYTYIFSDHWALLSWIVMTQFSYVCKTYSCIELTIPITNSYLLLWL